MAQRAWGFVTTVLYSRCSEDMLDELAFPRLSTGRILKGSLSAGGQKLISQALRHDALRMCYPGCLFYLTVKQSNRIFTARQELSPKIRES